MISPELDNENQIKDTYLKTFNVYPPNFVFIILFLERFITIFIKDLL